MKTTAETTRVPAWHVAILLALAATAYHAIKGGSLPDLIVGHGVLGRLLARLALTLGGNPIVWETNPSRRDGSTGYQVEEPDAEPARRYGSVYDVSGSGGIIDMLIGRLSPPSRPVFQSAAGEIFRMNTGYWYGKFLIALIAGLTCFAGMKLLDIPYAAPLSMFVAITDLIPNIGATLGTIPVVIVGLLEEPWKGVAIGACSALKRSYRDYLLKEAGEPILFVFLDGTEELIASRMAARVHEYMPLTLLASQFATLEVPEADENVLAIPITLTIEQIADRAVKAVPHLKAFKRKQ